MPALEVGGQQQCWPVRLLDLPTEPGQRNKDIERPPPGSPGDRSGRTVESSAMARTFSRAGNRSVLVGGQRHIARHQSRLLDPQTPPHPRAERPASARADSLRATPFPPGPSCLKGALARADSVELVRHAEDLDPVDTPGAIVVRDDAGHLQDRRDDSTKLRLQSRRQGPPGSNGPAAGRRIRPAPKRASSVFWRVNRTESPTASAPVNTPVATTTASRTARFVRQ